MEFITLFAGCLVIIAGFYWYAKHLFEDRNIWKSKYDEEAVLVKEKTELLAEYKEDLITVSKSAEDFSRRLIKAGTVNDELRRGIEIREKTIQDKEESIRAYLKKLGEKDELINAYQGQINELYKSVETLKKEHRFSIGTHKGNYTRLKAKNKQLKWEIRDLKKEVDLFNKLKENTVKVDPETFKELEESFRGFVDTVKTELTEEEFKVLNPFYIGFGEKNDYKEGDIAIFGGNKPAIGRIMGGDGDYYWFSIGNKYNALHYEYLRPATEGEKMSLPNGKEYIQFSDELAVQFRKK